MGNFFILYSLLKNKLILVFPFVSLAGAVSFLIIWIFEKPKYNQKQKIFAVIGLILCFLGILLVATGSEGLLNFVKELAISPLYLLFSLFVLIGFTLWIFLTYKSVSKEDISSENSTFLSVLGSFVVAVLSVLILNYSSITSFQFFNIRSYIYPILAGICVAFGILLTFSAFKGTTTKSKLQEAIVAILANAELIPLLFLSYFILHEWVWEGFVGTIIVLAGLFSLHFAEMIKK